MKMKRIQQIKLSLLCASAVVSLAANANAGSRNFAYSYETTTMSKGAMELESIVTWKTNTADDSKFERFDIRHEFEYGVTDRLQLAVYFADWRYEESSTEAGDADFHDVALEVIYNLTDPNTSPFGSAFYGEVKGSDDFVEFEAKYLLQKNIGQWIFIYNIGGAIEWEHNYEDDKAEWMQSIGCSYRISPSLSLGLEALHEIEIPDAEDFGDNGVYVGPNVAWKNNQLALTVAGLWQVTDLDGEPDFQLRTIFGFDF